MSEQDSRLTRAEMRIEQHDKMHEESQTSIRILTEGINKLVQAEVRREQDEQTFQRLFSEIGALRKDLQAFKDAQALKELAAYKGIVLKLVGLAGLVIGSVIAGHFSGRWLG